MTKIILLYDLISIIIGFSTSVVVFLLFLKNKIKRLKNYLFVEIFVLLIVISVTIDYLLILIGGKGELQWINWYFIQFFSCGICFFMPKTCQMTSEPVQKNIVIRIFEISSITFTAALIIEFLFLRHTIPINLSVYVFIFITLGMAILYFGIKTVQKQKKEFLYKRLKYYHLALRATGFIAILFLPFFFVIDFYGYIIPFFKEKIDAGFNLIPAFNIIMSISMVIGASLEILETENPVVELVADEEFIGKYKLTKRESEIMPLILKSLTYKEIGESLFISSGTIRSHLNHIYSKTGTKNRYQLAALLQEELRNR